MRRKLGLMTFWTVLLLIGVFNGASANFLMQLLGGRIGNNIQSRTIGTGGCPNDPFLKVSMMNIPGGVVQSTLNDLDSCLQGCLVLGTCVAVDYNNMALQPDGFKCYFHTQTTVAGSMLAMTEIDHYQKVDCSATTAAATTGSATGATSGTTAPVTTAATTIAPTAAVTTQPTTVATTAATTAAAVTTGAATTLSTAGTTTIAPTTTTTADPATTTIPDSGCPFAFEEFSNFAHPFGTNVTNGTVNINTEDCKLWCLNRPYCLAVDFDSNTGTCYYHDNIDTTLVMSLANVNHFRKTSCSAPVKCWSTSVTLTTAAQLSITNSTTDQVECTGFCYTRQTIMASSTILDRGCWSSSLSTSGVTGELGCLVDPSSTNGTNAILLCFCDTDRCNGLSISAQAAQILYLPLNNDMMDHSGNNRDGTSPVGYSTPTFNCFDAVGNCSAQFSGSECISVNSLAQASWGTVTVSGDIEDRASFSVWAKRINDGSTVTEGIFGNSITADDPTWRIIGEANHELSSAGIDTEFDSSPTLPDYPSISTPSNAWHLLTMVYDGRTDLTVVPPIVPTLNVYVDGEATNGNMRADNGSVQVRSQAVGLGCVQLTNFTGFIDEPRIFTESISIEDIQAMMAMADSNF